MLLKRIIDLSMTVLLLFLMSLQVTGQKFHEYLGFTMFLLVILHNFLNRRWYYSIFKGKYGATRILSTIINISLIISFIICALSGMFMSETFPFLNVYSLTSWARLAHLSSSWWSFVLMGIHLGLHWGMISVRIQGTKKFYLSILAVLISGYGLYIFIRENIYEYMFLITQFAFFDYDKNYALAIFENLSMLGFWTLIGYQGSRILIMSVLKRWKELFMPILFILLTVLISILFLYKEYLNWTGIIVSIFMFFIIGIFHPIVIKCEYYFSSKIWPLFLFLGIICCILSFSFSNHLFSSMFGVLGCTLLWCIRELKEQEKRVEKGWFPRNPKR